MSFMIAGAAVGGIVGGGALGVGIGALAGAGLGAMSSGSPSAPQATNYGNAAQQQGQANIAAAQAQTQLNRPNQITPWGSQMWYQGTPGGQTGSSGGGGSWTPTGNQLQGGSGSAIQAGNPGFYSTAGGGGQNPYGFGNTNPGGSQSPYQMYGSGNGFSPANQWTSVTTLAPDQQKILDQQNQISQSLLSTGQSGLDQVATTMGQKFDPQGLPAISGAPNGGDYAGLQQTATDAAMSRQNLQLDQQTEQLKAQLANQGITPGSDAYNRAMQPLEQSRVDATNQAFLTGTQYQNQLFNQGLSSAQQNNSANAQGFQQQAYQRSLPLNEVSALRSGSQVTAPQFSQYNNAGQVQAAPIFNAAVAQGQANQQQYANQVGAYNNQMSGLYGLGGAALMAFSDRRLKKNIRRIGTTAKGNAFYLFDYVWGETSTGVMADEVDPAAVSVGPGGFAMVDYARV